MALVDIGTAAHRLHLSYNQTLRLVLLGQLDAAKIAGRWRIEGESLERLARRRAEKASPVTEAPAAK